MSKKDPSPGQKISRHIDGSAWLRSVDPVFAGAVLAAARPLAVPRGKTLWEHGDPPGGIMGLVDGYAAARLDDTHEGVICGHAFGPGDWFGEVPTFTDTPRQVSVVALRDCSLQTVPLMALRTLCDRHPDGWRCLGALMAINMGIAAQIARDLLLSDPRLRCLSVIRRLSGTAEFPFELPITQSELAEMCALSRGAVSGVLGQLQSEGALERGYGKIVLAAAPIWKT